MHSALIITVCLIPLAMSDWYGEHHPKNIPCRDMSPSCPKLQATGICKTMSSHLCASTCGHCTPDDDSNTRPDPLTNPDEQIDPNNGYPETDTNTDNGFQNGQNPDDSINMPNGNEGNKPSDGIIEPPFSNGNFDDVERN